MKTKTCSMCKLVKDLRDYIPHKRDGVRSECKVCTGRRNRMSRYKLTFDEVVALEEHTCCEVCGSTERLVVEHSHTTGQVRGVLCSACNLVLGHAHDDAALLRKLADYLEQRS